MSVSGHHNTSGFSQPQLERLLEAAVVARGIKIERGWCTSCFSVCDFLRQLISFYVALQSAENGAGSVAARFNKWTPANGPDFAFARTLQSKYLVGCDGANSAVRKITGIAMVDMGFTSDWLVRSPSLPRASLSSPN